MSERLGGRWIFLALLCLAIAAPFVLPGFKVQLTKLWILIVLALTWDILGGRMGYNSFGNIFFFGIGVYTATIVQIAVFHDVGSYTSAAGMETLVFTPFQYFAGCFAGLAAGPVLATAAAAALGAGLLGLRGHYFAIATLGLGIAGGEIAAGWDFVGGSSGVQVPVYPGGIQAQQLFFYSLAAALALATLFFLRWLYTTRFGLAINAIRDDEDKAEAMGLHTTRYKSTAWCISAFFLGIAGGLFGHVVGFIDPREVAFTGATYGVWMILAAILGGKGTLWGPVLGALVFYVASELAWTFLFGWQRVALGILIVAVVLFVPGGLIGWLRQRLPSRRPTPAGDAGEPA